MDVQLVNARQANGFLAEAAKAVSPERSEDARRLLRVFHGRHVGLPVSLGVEISAAFPQAGYPNSQSHLRQLIYSALLSAVGLGSTRSGDPRHLDAVPRHHLIHDCLLPLAAQAVEATARNYLFSDDNDLPDVAPDAYENYAAEFRATLESLCTTVSPNGPTTSINIFWERCAHKLWSKLRRPNHARVTYRSHIEPDGMILRFVCGLNPMPDIGASATRLQPIPVDEQNPLFSYPRQGGVVDVHPSHRLEDIDDFLISEFMWPPAILADRWLNGANLAKHRPPPFDERRQVLLLGLSVDGATVPGVAMARVAWLDALFRFAVVLHRNGLHGSEIRFAQWFPEPGYAHCALRIGDYPQLAKFDVERVDRSDMRGFFRGAGWLPGFIATRPHHAVHAAGAPAPSREAERASRLGLLVNQIAPELQGVDSFDDRDDRVDFRLAIATAFTSGERSGDVTSWRAALHGSSVPVRSLRIHCPDQLSAGSEFTVEGHGVHPTVNASVELSSPGLSLSSLEEASASLSRHIFDFFMGDLDG